MYRPKKDQAAPTIRLEPLTTFPDGAILASALSQARQNAGRAVELTWPKPQAQVNFFLTVTSQPQAVDPIWIFSEGQGRDAREIWRYASGDSTLIYSLVMAESTGEVTGATDNSSFARGVDASKFSANTASSYSTSLLGLQATSGSRYPVVNASRSSRDATMEGDLTDMAVPNLLQSIVMSKMTGRLFVETGQTAAELFFEEGNLLHASAHEVVGDQAIMELVTWETGKFFFYRDEATSQRTVNRRLDAILMEGITLLDQSKWLMNNGVTMESYLDKKNANLSEGEFEKAVREGTPADAQLQKDFYILLDGCTSLFDLLRRKPMVKKDWVGIVFNLVNCGLVNVSKKPTRVDKTSFLESTAIDNAAIARVQALLARPDSGLMSYPSFHYFLNQEFQRYVAYSTPYSVIIFEMRSMKANKLEPLTIPALKEAMLRLRGITRQLDVLAHFETLSYVLLLPNTETPSAAMLAHRMLETLRSAPLGHDADNLALAFGIAGVPEDCRDMGLLLSAAKASKIVAQRNNYPIVMFKDMQAPPS